MGEGSIDLTVAYDIDRQYLRVKIQDTGIGIAPENHAKIFTTAQLDSSISRQHEGAGLGLAIASAIVQKMDGTITLQSQPQQGATFLIEFMLKKN